MNLSVRLPTGSVHLMQFDAEETVGSLKLRIGSELRLRDFYLVVEDHGRLGKDREDEQVAALGLCSGDEVVVNPVIPWIKSLVACFENATGGCFGSACVHPDGDRIAASGYRASLMSISTPHTPLTHYDLHSHSFQVVVDPSGQYAVTGHRDGTILVWEFSTGEKALCIPQAHVGWVCSVAVSCPPSQAPCIISGGRDRTIKVWDFDTGALLNSLSGDAYAVWSIATAPLSPTFAVACTGVHIFSLGGGGRSCGALAKLDTGPGVSSCACFSLDEALLAAGSNRGCIRVFTFPGGALLTELSPPSRERRVGVYSLVFASSRHLVSASADGVVRFWCTENWSYLTQLRTPSPILSLCFTPDSRHIVTCHSDFAVRVWE